MIPNAFRRPGLVMMALIVVAACIGGGRGEQARQAPPASRPVNHLPLVSDFPSVNALTAATLPASQPALAPIQPPTIVVPRDDQIQQAVDKGIGFLLSQFRNGEIPTTAELSQPQRQSLNALCVYALAQAGRSGNYPHLSIHGDVLPDLLNHLRGFQMVSDAETTNRPVTYGRSLRAAALATYNRPEDRTALQQDVAWLIRAQIDGAYTYDDFYSDLINQGLNHTSRAPDQDPRGLGRGAMYALMNVAVTMLLAGDGPYPPPANYAKPPPGSGSINSNFANGPQNYNTAIYPNYNKAIYPNYISRPPELFRPSLPPLQFYFPQPAGPLGGLPSPRVFKPDGMSNGPKLPNHPGPTGRGTGPILPPSAGPVNPVMPKPEYSFEFPWDNWNSQYGLFGVQAGAEAGVAVPTEYWAAAQKHWLACELATGQWSMAKNNPQGTLEMTAGGAASLLITRQYLDEASLKGQIGHDPYMPGLAAALAWLEKDRNSVDTPAAQTQYMGYDLFAIERAGLESGYKYFGSHDWFGELSAFVVHAQFPNGAWGHEDHGSNALVDTAYSLLFLCSGRHPVLMTKLKFDKSWDNRPSDVENLARFAGKQLERQIDWQVVGIEHTWDQWFDSPVVYLASHQAPRLKDRDYAELQKFAGTGGLIFTHADAGSGNFDQWVTNELVKRIVPGRAIVPIPDSDPIYSTLFKIPTHRKLMGVSNGARWLLVHSPADLGLAWEMRSDKARLADFQLGTNVFLYAAGRTDLRNRMDSPYASESANPITRVIRVARLSYAGNWDPEPGAWPRLSRVLHEDLGQVLVPEAVPMEKLAPGSTPIATLTGTESINCTKAQCTALADYVSAGGVLVIDSCGGKDEFTASVREKLLPVAFAAAGNASLPRELAVRMRLRPYAMDKHAGRAPEIQMLSMGKGFVVLSAIDLTSGLLGTNTWGIDGYQPASAQAFLEKLVAWAAK